MINTSSGKRILGAAVAEVKNYGLSGVHRTLQLGKQGPVLVGNADTDSFTITLQDAATLTTMGGANATSGTHFITKSQLDSVYTEATFLANVNYNDTSPILLGNISSGTKTIITTFEVTTAFDANAVVTVGDSTNNSLLMSDDYAEIEVTGTYQTINTVEFASNTALNIYVTQGGATQGAGTVLVSVVDGPVVNAGAINYGAGGGGIALANLSVSVNSPSGNGSLSYSNTTGVFTFTPADASLSNYGNSNVVTLLSSFGSNTVVTTGNISAGYFVGNGSLLTGITAGTNYTNSNVVTLLSSFGSNTLVTTGNVSAGNISTSGKFIGDGSSLTNVTVSVAGNITGTSQNVSLVAGSFTATFDNTGKLVLPSMGGDEGGEINFGVPASNTTLSTRVVLDVYQDRLRIFDGNTKGAYIDLSQAATGVGTLLNNRVAALVNAGTFVTMDLIKATVTTTGNRGLSLAATTGSFAINIGGTYGMATPASGGSAGTMTVTTTASASVFNWGFINQGDISTYILTDTTNSRAYRITVQIGASFNNNMISIERLI